MINLKTLRDWFVILLILLFIPKDNRLVMFDMKPEDGYGEVAIPVGDELLILAKNANREKVNLGLAGKVRLITLQRNQREGLRQENSISGLPESLMIISADRRANEQPGRSLFSEDKYYFRPKGLSILTQADLFYSYLLLGLLLGGFMLLGFVIARYSGEEDFQLPGKSKESEVPKGS